MLKNYPTLINGTAIPFPDSWEESPNKIVSNFESEAGGRKQIVIRGSRLKASGEWTVSSRWLKTFKEFRAANVLSVELYDAVTGARATHNMSIIEDSFTYALIPGSKIAGNTDGLYKLTFDMEEF